MVQSVRESVGVIGCPWFVEKADVVVAESEDIAGKTVIDLLGTAIVMEVLVIGEDINDELSSQQEIAPMFKHMDDGEKFSIPDWVIVLGLSEGGGVITHGVSEAIRVTLVKDGAGCVLRGINF